MKRGDRVLVTVRGERVPATVIDPVTALGNVQVRLDKPVRTAGSAWWEVVRNPDDVEAIQ